MRSKSQILSKLRADGHITDEEYKMLEQEPFDDAISRQATIEAFQMFRGYEANRTNAEWVDRIETVVKKLPPVTPQQKTGHWIQLDYQRGMFECSECHTQGYVDTEMYKPTWVACPRCGARMESEVRNDGII